MSLIAEIHRRTPIPFDYAKAQFEKNAHAPIGDDWHAFLRFWAELNYDAAEVYASVARERSDAFKAAQSAAQGVTNG